MTTTQTDHTQMTPHDASVLITSGFGTSSFSGAAINTAELFDPTNNFFLSIVECNQWAQTTLQP